MVSFGTMASSAETLDRSTLKSTAYQTSTVSGVATNGDKKCCDVHCNSLWSIWYGLIVLGFHAFLIYKAVSLFLIYVALPWPDGRQPYLELNIYVGLVGAGVVLLPFYFISFMFKIGNLANDGYKLGYKLSACAMDPPSVLARSSGVVRNAWHHGGPTAPFIHLVSAFCFVLPKIFIQARLIDVGFLSQDHVWKTDLDWLVPHQDRLVILQFLTGGAINMSSTTTQAPYHHPAAQIREYLEQQDTWWPVTPEFLNYAVALLVYSVRYPSVFWNTNKAFSFLFSLQLFANSIQNLMAIGGISIMYKVQVVGPQNVLHKYEPFLLNPPICMLLYILSCMIVTTSSCVVYMYGYHKFMTFVESEREKHNILLREGKTSLWAYFPHCSAMCVLIALAVCNAPLLYDYTLIYKGSLDGAILSNVIATILHLFLWIVLWLFLTMKQNWIFKLRVTVGHAVVKSARSIKLLNDVDLMNDGETSNDAMMIVAFGKSFTVVEPTPKKLIMNTLARAAIERDKQIEEAGSDETDRLLTKDDNRIYNHDSRLSTIERSKGPPSRVMSPATKQKVSFDQTSLMEHSDSLSPRYHHDRSMMGHSETSDQVDSNISSSSPLIHHDMSDDCDDLPPPPGHPDGRVMSSPRPGQTQVHVHSQNGHRKTPSILHNPEVQDVQTPRSNRSVDSGLPHDDITPRSDSMSTGSSSASPPDQHNNSNHMMTQREIQQQHRKSTSLDDINITSNNVERVQSQTQWKSSSLQRGMAGPPNGTAVAPPQVPSTGIYGTIGGSQAPGINGQQNPNGTLVIRRKSSNSRVNTAAEEEDIYGRCFNMRLNSFSEGMDGNVSRDPRVIDLNNTHSNTSSQAPSMASTPRQGSPVHHIQYQPNPNQFNTLPAQANGTPNGVKPTGPNPNSHNTLPARMNGQLPPPSPRNSYSGPTSTRVLTGRHFKPFDHRRMNPMAEIQEIPHGMHESTHSTIDSQYPSRSHGIQANGLYGTIDLPQNGPPSRPLSANGGNLIVQKNTHLPHLPPELRHTNYSSGMSHTPLLAGPKSNVKLVNPQLAEHHRDSANFSLTSNDSC